MAKARSTAASKAVCRLERWKRDIVFNTFIPGSEKMAARSIVFNDLKHRPLHCPFSLAVRGSSDVDDFGEVILAIFPGHHSHMPRSVHRAPIKYHKLPVPIIQLADIFASAMKPFSSPIVSPNAHPDIAYEIARSVLQSTVDASGTAVGEPG